MATDWGRALHDAGLQHLAACREALYHDDLCPVEECAHEVDQPASAPFDDCDVCVTREVLVGAWPVIVRMVRESACTVE